MTDGRANVECIEPDQSETAKGSSMTPLLDVRALKKSYPTGVGDRLVVLDGVTLSVMPGEVVSIVGESGTGKSTLLHLLGVLDRPDEGHIGFRGMDVLEKSDEELAAFRNRSIGFVFQFHHLLPEFDALENVAMPALIQHRRMGLVKEHALGLLSTMGLADRAHHRPNQLSGGEKQRVAIARALMNEPALVLADEPTGNLDLRTADELHKEILRLSRSLNQAFVIATHNVGFAAMTDRILRLEKGMLHEVDPADVAAWSG